MLFRSNWDKLWPDGPLGAYADLFMFFLGLETMYQNRSGKYKSYLPTHSEISVAPVSSVVLLSGQRKQKFSDLLG